MKTVNLVFPVMAVVVTACASPRYTNKSSNQQQFLKDRYECVQQTQTREEHLSGSATNDFAPVQYSSSVTPSCSAFGACLAAKGYIKSSDGELEVPSSAVVKCH